MQKEITTKKTACFHCGEDCSGETIRTQEKDFCCEGCKMVYCILNQNGLCDYYQLSKNPVTRKVSVLDFYTTSIRVK